MRRGVESARPAAAGLHLAALLATATMACGARTGLGWFEGDGGSGDAEPAPDVFGPFPCSYSPIGAPTPVRAGEGHSIEPRLAWGDGQLGLTYLVTDDPSVEGLGRPTFCRTHPDLGYSCAGERGLDAEEAHLRAPLAWGDDDLFGPSWSVCWSQGAGSARVRWLYPPAGESSILACCTETVTSCVDLAGQGASLWTALFTWSGGVETLRYRRLVDFGWEPGVLEPGYDVTGPLIFGGLAEDEGMVVAVRNDPGVLSVDRLDGPSLITYERRGEAAIGTSRIALRRPVAGLSWLVAAEGGTRIRFALFDVERQLLSSPIDVAFVEPTASGHAILAVAEGFVMAWTEWSPERYRVVVVPISVDGWVAQPWTPVVLLDTPDAGRLDLARDPALAYDGRSPHVAFTAVDERTGLLQIHMQQLDCHR